MKKITFGIIAVAIVIILVGLKFKAYENTIYKLTKENGQMQSNNKVETTSEKEKVITKYIYGEKVITKVEYVPVESHATVSVAKNDEVKIEVKHFGFCIKPNANILYDDKLQYGIAVRFIYWNRWGLCAGVSQELAPYIMIDRRATDFLPIFDNVSIGVLIGKDLLSATINIYL